jgi:hypothetical protein
MLTSTVDNFEPYQKPITGNIDLEPKKSNKWLGALAAISLSVGVLVPIHAEVCPTFKPGFIESNVDTLKLDLVSNLSPLGIFIDDQDIILINNYFENIPLAYDFIYRINPIINQIYDNCELRQELKLIYDYDTDGSILKLTIRTNLPIDDDFVAKDHIFNKEIEAKGLLDGLEYVVVSHG